MSEKEVEIIRVKAVKDEENYLQKREHINHFCKLKLCFCCSYILKRKVKIILLHSAAHTLPSMLRTEAVVSHGEGKRKTSTKIQKMRAHRQQQRKQTNSPVSAAVPVPVHASLLQQAAAPSPLPC